MWALNERGNLVNLKKSKCIYSVYVDTVDKYCIRVEFEKDNRVTLKSFDTEESAKEELRKLFFKLCGSNNKKKEGQ